MFSRKFDPLIAKYPNDAAPLGRVAQYFASRESSGKQVDSVRLTLDRLREIAGVDNRTSLANLVALLTSENILKRYLLVKSPTGDGIAEFESIDQVPSLIHDTYRDVDLEITPELLHTLYRVMP